MKFTSLIIILVIPASLAVGEVSRINQQCHPEKEMKFQLLGSTVTITAWINKEFDSDYNRHLEIEYSFLGKESYDYNDLIYVGSKKIKLYKTREGNEEELDTELVVSLEPGWQQFQLEVTSSKVDLWYQSKRILSTDLTFIIDRFKVTGSNVTINCLDRELWWLISEKESTKIPLTLHNGEQEINFYSKKEILPTLTLSNSNDFVTLGWHEGHIATYDIASKNHQKFLPAANKHTIIISCQHNVHMDVVCTLKGKEKVGRIRFYVREMPKALYLSSGNGDDFIVLIKMSPPPEQTSAVTLVSESETTSLKNTKDGSHTTLSAIIGILSTIIIPLCGAVWYCKRRLRKVSQSRDSVAECGTTSNGFKMAPSVKIKYFACNETKENGGGFMNKGSTENKKTNSEVHNPHVFRRDVESGDESERQPLYESSTETAQQQKFDETYIQSFSKFMIPDQEVDKCQYPRLVSQLCGSEVKGDTTTNGLKMDPSVIEKQDFGLNETRDGGCSMNKISIENKRKNSEAQQSRNLAGKKYGSTDSFIGAQGEETENSNFNETKIYFAEGGSPWENEYAETIELNPEVRKPHYSTRPVKFGDEKEL